MHHQVITPIFTIAYAFRMSQFQNLIRSRDSPLTHIHTCKLWWKDGDG